MRTTGIALLSAASLLAAGTAMAAEPKWTYLQLGYVQGDGFDDFGKSDAFELEGSIGFLGNYHAQLSYVDGDISDDGDDLDFDGFDLVLGYHQAITSSGATQFFADINYFDIDFDFDGGEGSVSNTGYGIGLGLRSFVGSNLELEGKITYTRGELDDDFFSDADYTDTSLEVGGRWHWTPNFSTGLMLALNDSTASTFGIGGDDQVAFPGF